jgi:hypothetical protein
MKIKGIEVEDFVNYKEPSMFIAIGDCDWKCCIEGGFDISICHNSPLAHAKEYEVDCEFLYNEYINNPITKAIVIGGLEPFTRFEDVYELIKYFRDHNCNDTFVIYTGYYPEEIESKLISLGQMNNLIIKFGRFVKNAPKKFDDVLGVELSSDNQYARFIECIELHT